MIRHSSNVIRFEGSITREERISRNSHNAGCYWFTGLSGAGKSTLARYLERQLFDSGKQVFVIDGDNVRHGLCGDLGFTPEDREENIRRVGHVARLMYDAGFIVLCCFISPSRSSRDFVRSRFPPGDFKEVYVSCDVDTCISRDPKGLYKKALSGEIADFTGISAPYEAPTNPETTLDTSRFTIEECVSILMD